MLARRSQHRAAGCAYILIAAIAEHNGAIVLRYDTDCDHIATVAGLQTRGSFRVASSHNHTVYNRQTSDVLPRVSRCPAESCRTRARLASHLAVGRHHAGRLSRGKRDCARPAVPGRTKRQKSQSTVVPAY